ncbi:MULTISPECIES: hypothetical protein [Acinetobacter]|uniref:hypothetical protein n=1 Tax=Acinetobacter TaxID=469 RepID=UPI001362115E|nr:MULTISPECIES: hypothetical protein [Acinetobacter]
MKLFKIFLLISTLFIAKAWAYDNKESEGHVLDWFEEKKSIALEEMLEKVKRGLEFKFADILYLCQVHDINIVLIGMVEDNPEIKKSHPWLVKSAYDDEKELEKIRERYKIKKGEECKTVPVKLD